MGAIALAIVVIAVTYAACMAHDTNAAYRRSETERK